MTVDVYVLDRAGVRAGATSRFSRHSERGTPEIGKVEVIIRGRSLIVNRNGAKLLLCPTEHSYPLMVTTVVIQGPCKSFFFWLHVALLESLALHIGRRSVRVMQNMCRNLHVPVADDPIRRLLSLVWAAIFRMV